MISNRIQYRAALAFGLFFVSTSGPLILQAKLSAPAVVFWRTLLAGLLMLCVSRTVPRVYWKSVALGALLLGAHMLLWVGAFNYTTFASNLLLLVAQPVLAAVIHLRMGRPVARTVWIGVVLATIGLLIIAQGDFGIGPRALLGDAMCIAAGLAIALFYVVTEKVRQQTTLPAFMGWTFLGCSVVALPFAAMVPNSLWGYSFSSWGYLLALVIVTTVGGHGLMNYAAKGLSLVTVNMVIVIEPAIGIGLGAVMFGASVVGRQVIGGLILGLAVMVALLGEKAPVPGPALD